MRLFTSFFADSEVKEKKYFSFLLPWALSAKKAFPNSQLKVIFINQKQTWLDWGFWKKELDFEIIHSEVSSLASYNDIMCSRFFAIRDNWKEAGDLNLFSELDVVFKTNPYLPKNKSICLKCWDELDFETKYSNTITLQSPQKTQDHFIMFRNDEFSKQFFNLCCAIYQDCKTNNSYESHYKQLTTWQNGYNSENIVEIVLQLLDRDRFYPVKDPDWDYKKFFLVHYPTWLPEEKRKDRILNCDIKGLAQSINPIVYLKYLDLIGLDNANELMLI
jgi:hypothetical protein